MTKRQERELQLLAVVYREPSRFVEICGKITARHFSSKDHAVVWNAMEDAFSAGEEINIITLMARGASADLCRAMEFGGTGEPVQSLVRTVLTEYASQLLVDGCKSLANVASQVDPKTGLPGSDPIMLAAAVKSLAADVEEVFTPGFSVGLDAHIDRYRDYVDRNHRGDVKQVPTGFKKLDDATQGGFHFGELVLLGGQPRTGKTALVCNMILGMLNNGISTGFIEGEMKAEDIFVRLNAIWSKREKVVVRNGLEYATVNMPFEQWMLNKPFHFIEATDRTRNPRDLRQMIERMARDGCRIVFLDYLQCFRERSVRISEYESVSGLVSMLRGMALRLNVVLFVLASLNRDVDAKTGRATLSSFRGSGELEFNASTALLLHRKSEELEETLDNTRKVELEVVKNREGIEGIVGLDFHLPTQRMVEAF